MKYKLLAAAFCLLFASFAFAQTDEINIIPRPQSIKIGEGKFTLSRKTVILASRPEDVRLADFVNDYLKSNRGFSLKVVRSRGKWVNVIALSGLWIESGFENGGYSLTINSKTVQVSATDDADRFYAIQSLIQLVPAGEGEVILPALDISDSPRFPYRGMHLDVSRHFMPVDFVKKYIDLMSRYKFNTFHWHLTDDQGWRIEIKKYPKLTEVGSKRPETMKDKNFSPYVGDGVPVEGFYTQEQIKDVVAFAQARYITVIPEIELPGHSSAALAAYPELGCKADYKYKVQTTWGIFKEVYCPTEKTFGFLEDVLTEVIRLFPDSPYIHIGGDEVLKDMWKDSAEVKALMEKEGLKDEHEVQSYFIRRMEKFINSKGKKIIGWDEILEGGLAPNATVMSWRGTKGGIAAAKEHHDVIMTPADFCYLDYGQGDPAYEPINIGGYLPLEKVYSFDPMPKELTADEQRYILGGQGNVWTEYLPTPASVEYMAFPRMLALSEALWSTPENKDFADFSKRLTANFPRLDKQSVNYRIGEPDGLTNIVTDGEKVSVTLRPATGTVVIYTTDGNDPDIKTAQRYSGPVEIILNEGEVKTLKAVVLSKTGRRSVVYSATVFRGKMREPVETDANTTGVVFTIHTGFEGGVLREESKSLNLSQFEKRTDLPRPFDVIFGGYFRATADGVYEFQIESAGSASFGLGDVNVRVDGKGERTLRSMIVPLKKGLHPVQLNYNRYVGPQDTLRVRWGIKGQGLRAMSGGDLVH